jgi:acyl-CoA dehydrogenase
MDRSYLDWPFFEPHHRKIAGDLDDWSRRSLKKKPDMWEGEGDPFGAARRAVTSLAEGGWLRYTVPGAYGGAFEGIDVRSLCIAREALAYHSGLVDFSFAMQGLGSGPISIAGSEALRTKYLPDVCEGKAIAALAVSEAAAGSNVAATATTARRDGDGFVLDGEKTWISNANIADFYVVLARTGEAAGAKGLTTFVVDADTPGFSVVETVDVTAPHPLGTLRFESCRVPEGNIVGAAGEGFKTIMATLDIFRSSVGAAALGFARRALQEATAHAGRRKLFDQPLAALQLTQARLADMAADVDASALLVYRAAWQKDSGARVTRESAMAKMFATEAAQRVIDSAVQLFGSAGVVRGHPVERLYRDIRPLRIYEGTTEIQKLIIAREHLKREGK